MTTPEPQERKDRRVSYSQYSLWATCPLQWKLKYVDKVAPRDNSVHLIFGTAVHFAIQAWMEKLYNGTKLQAQVFDMGAVFKDKLFELFKEGITVAEDGTKIYVCDQETLKEFYLDGIAILDHIRKYQKEYFPTPGVELVGCEIPLEVSLGQGIQFIGYIDLVLRYKREKKIVILDFKTSKAGWFYEKKDDKKLDQLLLYKDFYANVFDHLAEDIDVKFLILKRKVKEDAEWAAARKRVVAFDPPQGWNNVKKARARFDNFVNTTFNESGEVITENLKPTPSEKACRFCPFKLNKDLCPDGYYKE